MKRLIATLVVLSILFSFVLSEYVLAPRTKEYEESDHIVTLRFEKTNCEEFFQKNGIANGMRGGYGGDCLPIDSLGNDVDDLKFVGRCVNEEKNILVYIVGIRRKGDNDRQGVVHKDVDIDQPVISHSLNTISNIHKDEDEGEPAKREDEEEQEGEPEAQAINEKKQEQQPAAPAVVEKKQSKRSYDRDRDGFLSSSTSFFLRLSASSRSFKYEVVDFHLRRRGGHTYQVRRPDCYVNNDFCSDANTPYVSECVQNNPNQNTLSQGSSVYLEFTKRNSAPNTCKERSKSGSSCCRYVNTEKGICVANQKHSPSSNDSPHPFPHREEQDDQHEFQAEKKEQTPITIEYSNPHQKENSKYQFDGDFNDEFERRNQFQKEEFNAPSHGRKPATSLGKSVPAAGWVKLSPPTTENKPVEANQETPKA